MHVSVDHKAKIAWVIGHEHPIASFAFEEWGGASGASVAAQNYMNSDGEDWTAERTNAWNEAIEAAALICIKRASGAATVVGADAEGQLEGAHEDIRALLKTPV